MARKGRKGLIALGLGAALGAILVVAGPAGAMPVPERSVTAVPVTTGSFRFTGNDFISQSHDYDFSTAAGDRITLDGLGATVKIGAEPDPLHGFGLELVAPNGADLAVGTYVDALRPVIARPDQAGFDLYGDGRGCNQLRAEFTIHRIVIGADHVIQALDVSFVQHCEFLYKFARGRVVVNYDPVPAESPHTSFDMSGGDPFASGGRFTYQSTDGDAVAAQSERHGNTIYIFARRPDTLFGPSWNVVIAAPTGQVLTTDRYTSTAARPAADRPGLSVSSSSYQTCATESGIFTVNQLHVTEGGVVDRLDLFFQRECAGTVSAVGRVLINTTATPLHTIVAGAGTGTLRTTKGLRSAIVRGAVFCTEWARYTISGSVTVTVGAVTSTGWITRTTVDCDGTSAEWAVVVAASGLPRSDLLPATIEMNFVPAFDFLYNPPAEQVFTTSSLVLAAATNPLPPRRPGRIVAALP